MMNTATIRDHRNLAYFQRLEIPKGKNRAINARYQTIVVLYIRSCFAAQFIWKSCKWEAHSSKNTNSHYISRKFAIWIGIGVVLIRIIILKAAVVQIKSLTRGEHLPLRSKMAYSNLLLIYSLKRKQSNKNYIVLIFLLNILKFKVIFHRF